MTTVKNLENPQVLPINNHGDLRGAHIKLYGSVPENLLIEGFEIKEVFMTDSHKDVVRGLHFQEGAPQSKIITPLTGAIQVNVVYLDPKHEKFGEVEHYTLNSTDNKRLYVPGMCGLGYRVLTSETRVLYMANEHFVPGADTGIDPFDSELDTYWGENIDKDSAILSDRDKELGSFADYAKRVGK